MRINRFQKVRQTRISTLEVTMIDWRDQPDERTVRPIACQGIPEQKPLYQILVCQIAATLGKPVINKLRIIA